MLRFFFDAAYHCNARRAVSGPHFAPARRASGTGRNTPGSRRRAGSASLPPPGGRRQSATTAPRKTRDRAPALPDSVRPTTRPRQASHAMASLPPGPTRMAAARTELSPGGASASGSPGTAAGSGTATRRPGRRRGAPRCASLLRAGCGRAVSPAWAGAHKGGAPLAPARTRKASDQRALAQGRLQGDLETARTRRANRP